MKRLLVLVAVLSLLLAVAASAQNVILGGTFNKSVVPSDFTYWTKWGNWSNSGDSSDSHTADGSRCLKTKIQGNTTLPDTTAGMGVYQVVMLDANYNYTFSGWAKDDDGVDLVAFRVMKGNFTSGEIAVADVISGNGAAFAWNPSPKPTVYTQATGSFVSDSTASAYTVFTMVAGVAGKSGKFDDITLVKGTPAVPEPAGIIAFCSGIAGLIGMRRRK